MCIYYEIFSANIEQIFIFGFVFLYYYNIYLLKFLFLLFKDFCLKLFLGVLFIFLLGKKGEIFNNGNIYVYK